MPGTLMSMSPRPLRAVPVFAAAMLLLGACVGGGDDADVTTEDSTPLAGEVPVPPERSTPFCEAMIDLSDRLVTDPPDDVGGFIIEIYESVLPDVPAEILPDFVYVLADLKGEPLPPLPEPIVRATTVPPPTIDPASTTEPVVTEPPPTDPPVTDASGSVVEGSTPTSAPGVDEFNRADDTPAERLNDYVDFTCQGTLNNPGPPPTAPDVEIRDPDDL